MVGGWRLLQRADCGGQRAVRAWQRPKSRAHDLESAENAEVGGDSGQVGENIDEVNTDNEQVDE